jgi:hypothetical protein
MALLFLAAATPSGGQNSPPPTPARQSTVPPQSPAAGAIVSPSETSHGAHTVTVTFDYDFGKTPACTTTVTKGCVQQFIAFDISAGTKHPPILFPIPLPPNPVGVVHGITKTGPPIDFESGKHLISVSAMSPDGTHSRRSLCTTWITIP